MNPQIAPTKRIPAPGGKRPKGSALVLVIGFVAIFSIVISIILFATKRQTETVWRTRVFEDSLTAGQTVLQSMVNNIVFLVNNRPPSLQGSFNNLNPYIHSIIPGAPEGYRYATSTGTTDGEPLTYVRDLVNNNFTWKIVDEPGDPWDGYQTVRLDYELLTTVRQQEDSWRSQGFDGVSLRKRLTIDYVPLYQFAIFYHEGELELHPGPVMNVRGRVHTNSDLRLSCIDKLYFHELVTAAGHFYKGGGSEQGENQQGNVYFKDTAGATGNFKSFKTSDNKFVDSTWTDWASRALDMWDGNVRDKAHGVRAITPPLPQGKDAIEMIQRQKADDSDELKNVKFEYQADIIITGSPADISTVTAHDAQGNSIPTSYRDAGGTTRSYVSIGMFFDGQQRTVVRTIDIDMGRLKEFLDLNPDVSFENGVVYASCTPLPSDTWSVPTDWSPTGRDNYMGAVRIENAAELPRGPRDGFSFATDRPLYTTGNINTVNQTTAVMAGDSATVCSQDLTLKYSYTYYDPVQRKNITVNVSGNTEEKASSYLVPTAKETKTNTIFVMGNVPTTYTRPPSPTDPIPPVVGKSGGAHNVMRYLENWSGKKHYFTGSMIVLFASRLATRPWYNTSPYTYYSPPTREYNWDTNLKTAVPPPGMPFFFTAEEGEWQVVSRDYAIAHLPTSTE